MAHAITYTYFVWDVSKGSTETNKMINVLSFKAEKENPDTSISTFFHFAQKNDMIGLSINPSDVKITNYQLTDLNPLSAHTRTISLWVPLFRHSYDTLFRIRLQLAVSMENQSHLPTEKEINVSYCTELLPPGQLAMELSTSIQNTFNKISSTFSGKFPHSVDFALTTIDVQLLGYITVRFTSKKETTKVEEIVRSFFLQKRGSPPNEYWNLSINQVRRERTCQKLTHWSTDYSHSDSDDGNERIELSIPLSIIRPEITDPKLYLLRNKQRWEIPVKAFTRIHVIDLLCIDNE